MRTVFTGFDSAWGTHNTGAICELVLQNDGGLLIQGDQPVSVNWDMAIERAGRKTDGALDIWAIDQPLCVANESGCRPVEADLARALMAAFGCGAHSSNLTNPYWTPTARIWDLQRTFASNEYCHNPMAIPEANQGRHYFECYPHPAIVGLFDLDHILKYRVRHGDRIEWLLRTAPPKLGFRRIGYLECRHLCDGGACAKSGQRKQAECDYLRLRSRLLVAVRHGTVNNDR
jgi:predicted RNase H-like nuclease